jgi:hypothetical protein
MTKYLRKITYVGRKDLLWLTVLACGWQAPLPQGLYMAEEHGRGKLFT